MPRDSFEPIAHIVQAIDQTITEENRATNYEDIIHVIEALLDRGVAHSLSHSEHWRFKHIRECMADDIRVCQG